MGYWVKGFPLDSIVNGIGDNGLPMYSNGYDSARYREFISALVSDGVIASSGDEPLKVVKGEKHVVGITEYVPVTIKAGKAVVKGAFALVPSDYTEDLNFFNGQSDKKTVKVFVCIELERKTQFDPSEDTRFTFIEGTPVDYPNEAADPTVDKDVIVLARITQTSHFDSTLSRFVIDKFTIDDTRADEELCGFAAPFADVDLSTVNEKIDEAIYKLDVETEKAIELSQDALDETLAGNLTNKVENVSDAIRPMIHGEGYPNTEDIKNLLVPTLVYCDTRLANVDLDDVTTPGNYACVSPTNAATIENLPDGVAGAFRLCVGSQFGSRTGVDTNNVCQTMLVSETGDVLYRSRTLNGGWTEWTQYIRTGDIGIVSADMIADKSITSGKMYQSNRVERNASELFEIVGDYLTFEGKGYVKRFGFAMTVTFNVIAAKDIPAGTTITMNRKAALATPVEFGIFTTNDVLSGIMYDWGLQGKVPYAIAKNRGFRIVVQYYAN